MAIENPNWYDRNDKRLYEELFYRPKRELTKTEKEFVTKMYQRVFYRTR